MNFQFLNRSGLVQSLVINLFIFSMYASSQESIDFADHTDITSITHYRLPDWGYTNIWLHLLSNGYVRREPSGLETIRSRFVNLHIQPQYLSSHESEERTTSFYASTGVRGWYGYNNARTLPDSPPDQYLSGMQGDLSASGDYLNYISGSTFLYLDGTGLYSESRQKYEHVDVIIRRTMNGFGSVTLSTGIGIGRVRNITPVIRALRFYERASVVKPGADIGPDHIQRLAQHIAKASGYYTIYSRPARHFWGDLFSIMEPALGDLSAYEMFYLSEVMQEAIGVRLEGWNARAGLMYDFSYRFIRDESENIPTDQINVNRTKRITHYIGPQLSGTVYKNFSLRHQIGIQGLASFGSFSRTGWSDRTLHDWQIVMHFHPTWLWVMADRLLIGMKFFNDIRIIWYDNRWDPPKKNEIQRRHDLTCTAQYFVEDRIVFMGSVEFIYGDPLFSYMGGSGYRVSYNIGVTYYFLRGM